MPRLHATGCHRSSCSLAPWSSRSVSSSKPRSPCEPWLCCSPFIGGCERVPRHEAMLRKHQLAVRPISGGVPFEQWHSCGHVYPRGSEPSESCWDHATRPWHQACGHPCHKIDADDWLLQGFCCKKCEPSIQHVQELAASIAQACEPSVQHESRGPRANSRDALAACLLLLCCVCNGRSPTVYSWSACCP